MNALVLTATGLTLKQDWPVPTPAPGEALIRIHLAGICATDVEMTRGYKGGFTGVLGHEFVGAVVAAPEDPQWVGQRVVAEINIGCGHCHLCLRGLAKHCRQRTALGITDRDGAFAEFMAVPVANLHAVPPHVTDEQAVFVEPLAAAFEVLEQVDITPASRVIVLGAGRLGMLCAMALATTGCTLTVVGRHAARQQLLVERGIASAVAAGTQAHHDLTHQPADVVVDVTGSAQGFASALQLVRPGGVVVVKSTYAGGRHTLDTNRLVVDEITIVGSRCGPFPRALAALAAGSVVVDPLIDARFPLQDGLAAFAYAQQPGVLKVLLAPGDR